MRWVTRRKNDVFRESVFSQGGQDSWDVVVNIGGYKHRRKSYREGKEQQVLVT